MKVSYKKIVAIKIFKCGLILVAFAFITVIFGKISFCIGSKVFSSSNKTIEIDTIKSVIEIVASVFGGAFIAFKLVCRNLFHCITGSLNEVTLKISFDNEFDHAAGWIVNKGESTVKRRLNSVKYYTNFCVNIAVIFDLNLKSRPNYTQV